MVCQPFFPGISESGEAMVSRSLEDPKAHFQENLYLHVPHILLKSSLESFYKNGPLFRLIPKYRFFSPQSFNCGREIWIFLSVQGFCVKSLLKVNKKHT